MISSRVFICQCLNDLQWAVNNFRSGSSGQFSMGNQDYVLQNNISAMDRIRQFASLADRR